jgi:hypothetical protein
MIVGIGVRPAGDNDLAPVVDALGEGKQGVGKLGGMTERRYRVIANQRQGPVGLLEREAQPVGILPKVVDPHEELAKPGMRAGRRFAERAFQGDAAARLADLDDDLGDIGDQHLPQLGVGIMVDPRLAEQWPDLVEKQFHSFKLGHLDTPVRLDWRIRRE